MLSLELVRVWVYGFLGCSMYVCVAQHFKVEEYSIRNSVPIIKFGQYMKL